MNYASGWLLVLSLDMSSPKHTNRELRIWQVNIISQGLDFKNYKSLASSHSNLFGVPPGVARPLSKKVLPPVRRESRSRAKKPLPGTASAGIVRY